MTSKTTIRLMLLGAAALGLLIVYSTMVGLMMRHSSDAVGVAFGGSAAAIVAIAALALVLLGRSGAAPSKAMLVAAGMIAVSFIPALVHVAVQQSGNAHQRAEQRRIDKLLSDRIVASIKDAEARTAARRPYAPADAFEFLFTVRTSANSYEGAGDLSVPALAALRRALAGKIVDLNTPVQGLHSLNKTPEPLFLVYYKVWAKASGPRSMREIDWKMINMFAESGADLTLPAAAGFAEDLRKTATPTAGGGGFVELK